MLAFAQTIHMTASFLSPIAAGLLTQKSVSIIFSSFIFIYHSLENQNNMMFPTAISRFMEKSICSYCRCILQYVYRLSIIWYGGYTSMELSRSKISSIYSRRLSPVKWFVAEKEQVYSEPKKVV